MNPEELDELIRHNTNLVRMAQTLQSQMQAAVRICGQVVDCAEPMPGELHGEPLEYLVPAEEIEELRSVCILAKTWGLVDF